MTYNFIITQWKRSRFKFYHTDANLYFVQQLYDSEKKEWFFAQLFSLPLDLAVKILKPEFLNQKLKIIDIDKGADKNETSQS